MEDRRTAVRPHSQGGTRIRQSEWELGMAAMQVCPSGGDAHDLKSSDVVDVGPHARSVAIRWPVGQFSVMVRPWLTWMATVNASLSPPDLAPLTGAASSLSAPMATRT
jgi:hypothetical protein